MDDAQKDRHETRLYREYLNALRAAAAGGVSDLNLDCLEGITCPLEAEHEVAAALGAFCALPGGPGFYSKADLLNQVAEQLHGAPPAEIEPNHGGENGPSD